MSAGLTIEQVLARSLRMPRRRLAAQSAIAKTMERAEATAAAAKVAATSALHSALPAPTPSSSSSSSISQPVDDTINPAAASSPAEPASSSSSPAASSTSHHAPPVTLPGPSASKQQQRYNIPIPREEPDPYPDRPMLRRLPAQGLARNSDDLLSHLVACRQLGDWRDALTVFKAHPDTMTVNRAHINALVETLVGADKTAVLEEMAVTNQFANDYQSDTVLRTTASALNARNRWKEALGVLSAIKAIPAPIEAYNEIIGACDATDSWQEAMKIVFDLKDKHDQYLTELGSYERAKAELAAEQEEADNAAGSSSASSSTVSVGTSSSSARGDPNAPQQKFPKPDAVTWTSLITILEKCGKDTLAQEVLKVVPPAERETILASYAALIYTWSQQKKKRF